MRWMTAVVSAAAMAAVLLAGIPGTEARAAEQPSPTSMPTADKQAFEDIIRDYILANPEVILQSLNAWQARQQATEQREAQAAVASFKSELENDAADPVAGARNGDITIVEFFDYQCGYCKRVFPAVQALLKDDDRIRYVFKEFPILGPESITAAKAALAVWNLAPDKYMAFHGALMTARGRLSDERILDTAAGLGLERAKVKGEMESAAVSEALQRNLQLARNLKVNGTPAFVIGGKLVPGAIDLDAMRELVAEARKG